MDDGRKQILVIEDDPDMQFAIRAALQQEGHELSFCSTGSAALAWMQQRRPDLVLLDIMLSTPSEGFHIAYHMKRDDLLRNVPIIVISAIGERSGMNFASEIGTDYLPANRFLAKPFETQALRKAVAEVLAQD